MCRPPHSVGAALIQVRVHIARVGVQVKAMHAGVVQAELERQLVVVISRLRAKHS